MKLYQLDTKGNVKVWIAEVVNCGHYSELIIKSGRNGSPSLTTNVSAISSGKNFGKANETTHFEQAVSQMESKIRSKIKKGYVEDITKAQSSSILGSGLPAPMLAKKYSWDGSQNGSKTLAQLKLTNKEICVQPKLDGNRCLIKLENGIATMHTRKGTKMPVQLNHILQEIDCEAIGPEIVLDGELFCNDFSFNELNGLLKRVTCTQEDLIKRKAIRFHLYDVMIDKGYADRYKFIQQFASPNIIIIENRTIIATIDNINDNLEDFLASGYEGLMIRQLNGGYENKRSWQLCKVKVFEDDEFELVDFQEDVRGGFVGSFVMKDEKGNIFNAGASGQSVEKRTEMWYNRETYLGKTATVEFFGLSEYGIPRFPKFKGIRK